MTDTGSTQISAQPSGGYSGVVSLSLSDVPVGATATLQASEVAIGPAIGNTQLVLERGTAAPGTYSLLVTASDGSLSRKAFVTWTISTIDAGAPDAGVPDAGVPDAGVPDAGVPDAGVPDAGVPDAGVPDAGVPDAGVPDAGVPDAGTPDAGSTEPRLADLQDPFNGPGVDTSRWVVWKDSTGSSASASGGLLALSLEPNTGRAGVHVGSRQPLALSDSSVHVRVPGVLGSGVSASQRMKVAPDIYGAAHVGFWLEGGQLYLTWSAGDARFAQGTLKYSATTHAWWRIREQGGVVSLGDLAGRARLADRGLLAGFQARLRSRICSRRVRGEGVGHGKPESGERAIRPAQPVMDAGRAGGGSGPPVRGQG